VVLSKKDQFSLLSKNNPSKKIFNLIISQIPNSIFSKLDFLFFQEIIKKKIVNLYLIKKKNKLSSIITVTSVKNYELLKKKIIIRLLINPVLILTNINFLFNLISRNSKNINSKYKNKYLHLLHLVIFKKAFFGNSLQKKDKILNFFFKKIVKINNANFFYLCYESDNFKANKYYKRNNFVIYNKNKKTIFAKKRII
tara:strand:- start:244 stop:834 length:591 start_codon:yes stop_codon:yes gene_type:complete